MLTALKYLMNGAKFPNWAKLILALCIIAAIYVGQFATVGTLADVQKKAATSQLRAQRQYISLIRNDIAELHDELEDVAERDSIRARRIERKLDKTNARIDDINENGTDGTNQRIDELIRTIDRKGKR